MKHPLEVLILGAGGHAQVVADILQRSHETYGEYKPIGFLDDNPALIGKTISDLPVLGRIGQLNVIDHDAVIIGIGDNKTRACLFEIIQRKGEKLINAIHPFAILAKDVQLGKGVMICAGVIVNTGTSIEDNIIINTGATVDHHSVIGSHTHIAPGVHMGGEIEIGQGTLVGIGATIIPGCSVGEWSIIGAGTVVIKDIPSYTTAVGNPAYILKRSNAI